MIGPLNPYAQLSTPQVQSAQQNQQQNNVAGLSGDVSGTQQNNGKQRTAPIADSQNSAKSSSGETLEERRERLQLLAGAALTGSAARGNLVDISV